jgi:hypothetical protein
MVHRHDEAMGQQLADKAVDFLAGGCRIMPAGDGLKDIDSRQAGNQQGPELAAALVKRIIIASFEIHDDRLAVNDIGDDRGFVERKSLAV